MQTLNLTKKYETYFEYKDSGVEWLGKIPSNWVVSKARKFISKIESGVWGDDPIGNKYDIKCLRVADFDYDRLTINKIETLRNIPYLSKNKVLINGDILIEKSGGGEKQTVGRAVIYESDEKMVCANFIDIVRLKGNIIPKFFVYLLSSTYCSKLNLKSVKQNTGIQNLDIYSYFSEFFTFPSIEKQKEIIGCLDAKTQLIDQIIEKKGKLIELLREKRTAVISRRINNISGKFGKLKHFAKINPGRQAIGIADVGETVSFIPMEAISETGSLELQARRYEDVKEGFTFFRNGDVVLAKITPCYENGKAGVIKDLKGGFGFGTTEFIVIRPSKKIISDYLYYLIFSDKFRKLGEVEMRGTAGQKRVTNFFVRNYELNLPDIKQQETLAQKLNAETKLIDDTLIKVENSIEILKEFKVSLISNVVTGKVRVD